MVAHWCEVGWCDVVGVMSCGVKLVSVKSSGVELVGVMSVVALPCVSGLGLAKREPTIEAVMRNII